MWKTSMKIFVICLSFCVYYPLAASSVRESSGSLKLEYFTLRLNHATVYNFRPKPRSFSHTSFKFTAQKGYFISAESFISFKKGKVYLKSNYGKNKTLFKESNHQSVTGRHIRLFTLNVKLIHKKSNKQLLVKKKIKVSYNFSNNKNRRGMKLVLKVID